MERGKAGQIQVIERREDQEMPIGILHNGRLGKLNGARNNKFLIPAVCLDKDRGPGRSVVYRSMISILGGYKNLWHQSRLLCRSIVLVALSPYASNAQRSSQTSLLSDAETDTAAPMVDMLAGINLDSGEVILFSLFGGAMSFALMAAFWLIRERNRATDENKKMRAIISSYKATNERNQALVNVVDQRVVIWNGTDQKPVVLGSLSDACGAPSSKKDFLCFGKWISADNCKTFEEAVKGLRKQADAFDMALQTSGGGAIEAQGRTSGSFAFVRFIELTGERAALAHLEAEHSRLLATFESIQALFDRLDMQIWLSNRDGGLYWANNAYARAVEAANSLAVIDGKISLFDRAERLKIQASTNERGYFSGSLPVIISGDRKIVDVVEVVGENGGAGIAVDRSEIEVVRNTLEQTIASHAITLDQLATAIAIFDADKNLQFYNSSYQQLWQLDSGFLETKPSNADILGAMRENNRLASQPDWHKWREEQLNIYQAIEAREEWWHLPDGITLRVVASPQALGGATWIFEDVTEELELRSNYNALVRVQGETLDHLSEAVAVFGSDGKLRLSNPALSKMLRQDESEIKPGLHIGELTRLLKNTVSSPDVWQDIVTSITGYDDERSGRMGRLYLSDGKIIQFALVPLPDGRTMLTLIDVTANVNIELALTERNEALEEAGNLKNRFLQHVSYELRTPLTTIAGFGELLSMKQTGKLNAVQSEYLNHINVSSAVLKTIIDDILDLTTIDAGVMELELRKFEVAPAVSGVVDSLSKVIESNHVSVNTVGIAASCKVIADSTRFRQIIYNLVSNAVKHSPDGGTISVGCQTTDGRVQIWVADEGPGIPLEERELVFSRFENGSTGDVGKGAGLGLSIVKSFMILHDGDVHIENNHQQGAKFVCSFPVTPDQASKQTRRAAQ